ncbi:low molecular weight phosphatase family protein [Cuniculiplasma sp. SKW3]|uniref:arsenate-mycothiol transferase ArsC n=1 Tax=Cuniculiplasma sp. SKW3 TaxID=3400170 RepID=UPI003FD46852
MKGKVLFVCVENAGRSKMAEAFGKKYGIDCISAGTVPSAEVNPVVREVMNEIGVPISDHRPRMMTREMVDNADLVVIMGCSVEDSCPAPLVSSMKKKMVDWGLDDPKGKPKEEVKRIRDRIESLVRELANSNN